MAGGRVGEECVGHACTCVHESLTIPSPLLEPCLIEKLNIKEPCGITGTNTCIYSIFKTNHMSYTCIYIRTSIHTPCYFWNTHMHCTCRFSQAYNCRLTYLIFTTPTKIAQTHVHVYTHSYCVVPLGKVMWNTWVYIAVFTSCQ